MSIEQGNKDGDEGEMGFVGHIPLPGEGSPTITFWKSGKQDEPGTSFTIFLTLKNFRDELSKLVANIRAGRNK